MNEMRSEDLKETICSVIKIHKVLSRSISCSENAEQISALHSIGFEKWLLRVRKRTHAREHVARPWAGPKAAFRDRTMEAFKVRQWEPLK